MALLKRKIVSNGLAISLILSSLSTTHVSANQKETIRFSDIKNHWAQNFIEEFLGKGYIEGYGDNTFRPNRNVTRAEFIKIVNKAFGFKQQGKEEFIDVDKDDWYYEDVLKAVKQGYIEGYEDDTFRPNNEITREEACKIIGSILDTKGNGKTEFKDNDEIGKWAIEYIDGLVDLGIIEGYGDNTFRPKGSTTRAETLKIASKSKDIEDDNTGGGGVTPPKPDPDIEIVRQIEGLIKDLPSINEVTLDYKEKIENVLKKYNDLTDKQKKLVKEEYKNKLNQLEEKIKELEANLSLSQYKEQAIKELDVYVNLSYYNNKAQDKIKKIIENGKIQINNCKTKEDVDNRVKEIHSDIDKVEISAKTLRESNIATFEELKQWKQEMEDLKTQVDNITSIIDFQIGIVEGKIPLVGKIIDIENDKVRVGKTVYDLTNNYETYATEEKINNAIKQGIDRKNTSDKLIQGELAKIIDALLKNGINIPIGSYTVQNIPIPAGMSKENTVDLIAELLTIEDFEVNINPKTAQMEIPSDKLDLQQLEILLEQSAQENTKISVDELIELIKKIPPFKLNVAWNTDGFSSELGTESNINTNISISLNLEDVVELATDPTIEEIINSLLEGTEIDLSFIKSMAEYLGLDLSKYNVGIGYTVGFDFEVIDTSTETTVTLPTLILPQNADVATVNKILDDITNDYVGKIIGGNHPLQFKVIANWEEYTNESTQLKGNIKIQLNNIVLINHNTIIPIEYVNMTE